MTKRVTSDEMMFARPEDVDVRELYWIFAIPAVTSLLLCALGGGVAALVLSLLT